MEHKQLKPFPDSFLWGSSSAAYQIEGAPLEDGKKASVWDNYVKLEGKTYKGTSGDIAVDHYHKYKEDISLMKKMGLKSYRFSISWSRVIPNGRGEVNKEGLEFYKKIVNELIENGIEPVMTLYHWDLPQALQDLYGGWESREIINDFVAYAELLFSEFNNKVKYWITLNEQNIFTNQGWITATHPPGKMDVNLYYQVNHIANLVNASVINKFHEMKIVGKIGPSFAYGPQYSFGSNPWDVLAAENAEDFLANYWLDIYMHGEYPKVVELYIEENKLDKIFEKEDFELLKSAKPDFLGINYYQTNTNIWDSKLHDNNHSTLNDGEVKKFPLNLGTNQLFRRVNNPFLSHTKWDWEVDSEGLRIGLRRLTSRYRIPIMITENGLGEFDKNEDGRIVDTYRIKYLESHIKAINKAISDGCDVIGYHVWSFTDLLSWLNGYQKRYGLVYVDQNEEMNGSLKRIPKDSYYWYKNVIETNGKNIE